MFIYPQLPSRVYTRVGVYTYGHVMYIPAYVSVQILAATYLQGMGVVISGNVLECLQKLRQYSVYSYPELVCMTDISCEAPK